MAEIQERHEAVKDLETSLLDLHQIFLDMSVLVSSQGEMLDNIEQQVSICSCVTSIAGVQQLHQSNLTAIWLNLSPFYMQLSLIFCSSKVTGKIGFLACYLCK